MIDKKTGSADSGLSKGSVDAVYHKIDEQIDLFIFLKMPKPGINNK